MLQQRHGQGTKGSVGNSQARLSGEAGNQRRASQEKPCERQNSLVVKSTGSGQDCLGSNPSTTGSVNLQLLNLFHFAHHKMGKKWLLSQKYSEYFI